MVSFSLLCQIFCISGCGCGEDGRECEGRGWSSFPKTHTRRPIPIIRAEGLLRMITAYLNRIASAVPEHDVHDAFVVFAEQMLANRRLRTVFRRMVSCADIDLGAVHPGGRSILAAVEKGLELPVDALAASREVLSCFGNMSSATVMFVLQRIMQQALPGQRGCAMSFGPGLTAETMRFHAV
jgi:Chalcone and stilbene synthases, C-terminal domain